jgi:hypothetical protein
MAKPVVDYSAILETLCRHSVDFIVVAAQEELHHRGHRGHRAHRGHPEEM